MNIIELIPQPLHYEPFNRSREKFVPEKPGCYVLTTASKTVLYVGLTNNLRRRMNNHLDDLRKISETKEGRAVLFYWIETLETNKIERTWMNIHLLHEGCLPVLNGKYSPTSI